MQSPLPAGRTFVSESGIRPRTSASLPGRHSEYIRQCCRFLVTGRQKWELIFSSDFDSRSQWRDRMGSSAESLSQISSESHMLLPTLHPQFYWHLQFRSKKNDGINISNNSTPGSAREDKSSIFDPRHKQRAQGFERFEEITDKKRRKDSQSKQINK